MQSMLQMWQDSEMAKRFEAITQNKRASYHLEAAIN